MVYGLLADLVVVVHLGFIAFVAVGGLLSWRWPALIRLHLPSALWALGTVTIGFLCPLTWLEKALRSLAGEDAYGGGFVDRYVEGVVYPQSLTPLLRGLVAVAVVAGYAGLVRRSRSSAQASST